MARTDFDFDKAGNETLKTIRERRSVRRFTEEDVGDDLIRQLLDAANRAPPRSFCAWPRYFLMIPLMATIISLA